MTVFSTKGKIKKLKKKKKNQRRNKKKYQNIKFRFVKTEKINSIVQKICQKRFSFELLYNRISFMDLKVTMTGNPSVTWLCINLNIYSIVYIAVSDWCLVSYSLHCSPYVAFETGEENLFNN